MADNVDFSSSDDPELERLRAEIANLKSVLAERARDVSDAIGARAEAVRDNPGTHGAALLIGGAIGLLVGMALGGVAAPERRWWER